jgi:AcrR family transcriptional regulator
MSPRHYDMSRRAAASNETRHRIVEATAKLHGERGVFGTSWQDIAREADVSVSTVYSHFPSLDELLPACGQLVMSRVRPPTADSAAEVIGDARSTRERLIRVARELFAFYERGGPHIEVDVRERQLPGMREWENAQRATVAVLVRAALAGESPSAASVQRISAFFDLGTYKALRARGVSTKRAAETVAETALALLKQPPSARSGGAE